MPIGLTGCDTPARRISSSMMSWSSGSASSPYGSGQCGTTYPASTSCFGVGFGFWVNHARTSRRRGSSSAGRSISIGGLKQPARAATSQRVSRLPRWSGMTMLTLIRHAESQAAIDGIVGGSNGRHRPHRPAGGGRPRRLRDRLLDTGFERRCRAHERPPAGDRDRGRSSRPRSAASRSSEDCDLCELHPGDADGIPWDEYRRSVRHRVAAPTSTTVLHPAARACWSSSNARTRVVADIVARLADEKVVDRLARRLHQCGVPASPRARHRRRPAVLPRTRRTHRSRRGARRDDARQTRGDSIATTTPRTSKAWLSVRGAMMCR